MAPHDVRLVRYRRHLERAAERARAELGALEREAARLEAVRQALRAEQAALSERLQAAQDVETIAFLLREWEQCHQRLGALSADAARVAQAVSDAREAVRALWQATERVDRWLSARAEAEARRHRRRWARALEEMLAARSAPEEV
ncbi:MAG: hypothetical protein K6U14_06605 [Firmicutes bacterium]|nr:hypothetical protein [Alicyclobacillaceae bacterium]MCL6497291.1 hypothetical protein [Bacillota bacterium]